MEIERGGKRARERMRKEGVRNETEERWKLREVAREREKTEKGRV